MKTWVLGLFLLAALGAAAQDLQVAYTEGVVELAAGGTWKELSPGDRLPANARIRLSEDSFAELSQGATRLSVSQPGVYLVADLVAASKKVASWKLSQVVGGKLKGAVSGGARGDSTAAGGVRAKQAAPETVEWVESTGSQEAMDEGRSLLAEERFDEALKVFQDALKAYPGEEPIFYYYIATTYSRQRRTALALRTLEQARLEPQESMYTDLVLLKGQLLLESLAFTDALALFDSQLAQHPEGGFAQALLILSAYSYQGLGRNQGAREALQKAVNLDSSSELGREAANLLKQL
jgi:tetratricopeptide (TPR) repeat protein